MSLLPSVATYITVEGSRFRSAVSEFLVQTIGKSINYLLDRVDAIETAVGGTSINGSVPAVNTRAAGNSADLSYTAPASTTFIGILTVTRNVTVSGAVSFNGTITASTTAPVSIGVYLATGENVLITSGGITTGEVELAGAEYTSDTITIP